MVLEWLLVGNDDETPAEEVLNSVTHLVGLCCMIYGVYLMCYTIILQKERDWFRIISVFGYGIALISAYLISSMYHISGLINPNWKLFLRPLDHSIIYLAISGTYTPLILINVIQKGGETFIGILVLLIEWIGAIVGIIIKMVYQIDELPLSVSIGLYVVLGWAIILVIKPTFKNISPEEKFWVFLGGVLYSSGIFFMLFERLPFNHGIWHVFVIGGSLSHYVAVMLAVSNKTDTKSLIHFIKHEVLCKVNLLVKND